jgi:hypothetical protein
MFHVTAAVRVFAHATSAAFPIQVCFPIKVNSQTLRGRAVLSAHHVLFQLVCDVCNIQHFVACMQTGPGDVDYRSLLGLDYVITQAQAYGALHAPAPVPPPCILRCSSNARCQGDTVAYFCGRVS